MGEVHIGTVEEDDLPGADGRADFAGTRVVVVSGRVDDGKARREDVQIEPHFAMSSHFF